MQNKFQDIQGYRERPYLKPLMCGYVTAEIGSLVASRVAIFDVDLHPDRGNYVYIDGQRAEVTSSAVPFPRQHFLETVPCSGFCGVQASRGLVGMKVDLSFCEKILGDDDRPRAGLGSS